MTAPPSPPQPPGEYVIPSRYWAWLGSRRALVVVLWLIAITAGVALTVRALQIAMALFVAAGALGVGLHYDGNVEFELEITPAMSGFELVREALTGATPVLAPGAMALLGLIGFAHAYRHPRVMSGGTVLIPEGDI